MAQVALSVVMLIGAGLLARSVYLLQRAELGLDPRQVLTVQVQPVPDGLRGIDNASYYPALLERIATLPGVRSAGFGRMFPYRTSVLGGELIGFVGAPDGDVRAPLDIVSPGFFETLSIPLLAGRLPTWSDGVDTEVAVVSESLARALAPDGNVVGRRVRYGSDREHQDVVIVGVVGNASQGNPRRSDPLVFYRAALQFIRYPISPIFVIKTAGSVAPVVAAVRDVVDDAGREYVHAAMMLEEVFRRAPTSERMSATLAIAVAGLALVLVFVGVHGALAYNVARRTREIGVHLAIGATPGAAARTVLREGLIVTLIGLAMGVPAAIAAARGLRALMFGTSVADPFTVVATAVFVSGNGPRRRNHSGAPRRNC